jgi:hypothetical protein
MSYLPDSLRLDVSQTLSIRCFSRYFEVRFRIVGGRS